MQSLRLSIGAKGAGAKMSDEKYMAEWTKICVAYCKKVNAELLFVNTSSFGVQYPDGTFHHIHADELAQILGIDEAKA